jgi:hypothetical protein
MALKESLAIYPFRCPDEGTGTPLEMLDQRRAEPRLSTYSMGQCYLANDSKALVVY